MEKKMETTTRGLGFGALGLGFMFYCLGFGILGGLETLQVRQRATRFYGIWREVLWTLNQFGRFLQSDETIQGTALRLDFSSQGCGD